MPYCPKCGTRTAKGDEFCRECGTRMVPIAPPTKPALPKGKPAPPKTREPTTAKTEVAQMRDKIINYRWITIATLFFMITFVIFGWIWILAIPLFTIFEFFIVAIILLVFYFCNEKRRILIQRLPAPERTEKMADYYKWWAKVGVFIAFISGFIGFLFYTSAESPSTVVGNLSTSGEYLLTGFYWMITIISVIVIVNCYWKLRRY